MTDQPRTHRLDAVAWMREASPYIRAHRGQTFVVYFGGEAVNEHAIDGLVQDLILLRDLGVKLIVVHGSRPQIDARVKNLRIDQQ
ncbi:MAG: amino-acid N-acetyltransferase, partial [Gammaproteobacteria bacterium]|nr:amino-acid N-acetyltransferase [Gammaproteobacteria bacterium]